MFDPAIIWNVGQLLGFVMLLRYQQVQIRDNKIAMEILVKDSYTKSEVNDRIDLKLRPIEVGIDHLKTEMSEIKNMIGRLLDEKNK